MAYNWNCPPTYRAVGTSTGGVELINNNNTTAPATDFRFGDVPLPANVYSDLQAAGIGVVHLPILLSTVSIHGNVPVPSSSSFTSDGTRTSEQQQRQRVELDACLLARIFRQSGIREWGHPDIVARNPWLEGSTLPITVARRARGSITLTSVSSVSC